eukprot:754339-Hanusia_phi.AAC.2
MRAAPSSETPGTAVPSSAMAVAPALPQFVPLQQPTGAGVVSIPGSSVNLRGQLPSMLQGVGSTRQ